MKIKNILTVIAIAVCISVSAMGAEKRVFGYNFKKGDNYYIRYDIERTIKPQTGPAKGQVINQNFAFGFEIKVIKITEENDAWLKCKFGWLKVYQKDFEKEVSYNSAEDKEISPLLWGYKALMGESFAIRISKTGQIHEVVGFLDIHKNIDNKIKPNPAKKIQMRQIKAQFNNYSMKELLTIQTDIYPDKKIKPGDSWKKNIETNYDSQVTYSNKYKLDDINSDGVAEITLDSKIKTSSGAKPVMKNNAKLKSKTTGSQSGKIKVNPMTGEILNSNISQQISSTVEIISDMPLTSGTNQTETSSLIKFEFKKIKVMAAPKDQ